MRLLRDFRWLLVLTLLALVPPVVFVVAAKPSAQVAAKATPRVVLAAPTAMPPASAASPTTANSPTARATLVAMATLEPTAANTATPLPTNEPSRAEPASRGGARPDAVAVAPAGNPAPPAVDTPEPEPVVTREVAAVDTPVPLPQPTPVPPTRVPTATRVPATPTPVPAPPQPAVGPEISFTLDLLNRSRAAAGLPALQLDGTISVAARRHAEDMAANDYLAHVNRQGQQPWDRMRAAGAQFGWAAENLGRAWAGSGPAEPAIQQMHDMMMAETPPNDGHRVNILSPKARRVGVGVARTSGWVYLVTDFAD